MKHRIIALAFAAFAGPALALEVGPPFEQAQFDRQLPDIRFPAAEHAMPRPAMGGMHSMGAAGATAAEPMMAPAMQPGADAPRSNGAMHGELRSEASAGSDFVLPAPE